MTDFRLPVAKKSQVSYLAATILGGVLMGLTPAPFNAWPLAWIALAPLWVVVLQNPRRQFLNQPLLIGSLLWGVGYHGLALLWITDLHPLTWLGIPWLGSIAIALFCWLFITLWGSALVVIWAFLLRLLGARLHILPPFSRVLIGAALWCSLETLWSWGPLYWTSLSYTQSPYNLSILHLGQLSGQFTVTAAIIAINGLLAEAWLARTVPLPTPTASRQLLHLPFTSPNSKSQISSRAEQNHAPRAINPKSKIQNPKSLTLAALILLACLHLLGFGLYSRSLDEAPDKALKVGIIQGNVPTQIKLTPAGKRQALRSYTEGYKTLASQGADAVLTPEGALPVLWRGATKTENPLYQAIQAQGVVAWLGTFAPTDDSLGTDGALRITQSLLTITGTGEQFSRYNKVKLVPLGEYIPFETILGKWVEKLSSMRYSLEPGTVSQRFDTPFGRAAVGICYESAYGEIFRTQVADGGQFILTASNNGAYSPPMMAQHHAQDVMRAVETDRWAVRATNTGLSGIVNRHGQTLWLSKPNRYGTHIATIYRQHTKTLYVRWGNWLTPALIIVSGIAIAIGFCRQSRP
ncbi:MAG: apolipoprotein N-acyltransferase [Pseudanabaenales cyanobacterium]|nr:apolipoprotein N-acyltransferase [Pseudanabaenales cyanobacterium]